MKNTRRTRRKKYENTRIENIAKNIEKHAEKRRKKYEKIHEK